MIINIYLITEDIEEPLKVNKDRRERGREDKARKELVSIDAVHENAKNAGKSVINHLSKYSSV